jgi:uroporphyrinogen decarboxylase
MFETTKCLLGFQHFMMCSTRDLDPIRKIYDIVTEWLIEVANNAVDLGADMILVNGDLAFNTGTFLNPRILKEVHIPKLAQAARAIKDRRAYVFYHSHGNIWQVIDAIAESGVDAVHPFAAEDRMDIAIVKKVFGDKIAVAGNISTDLLSRGTEAEVETVTRKTIERTAAGGGYILMAGSSIHSGVNPKNYKKMVETTQYYGRY